MDTPVNVNQAVRWAFATFRGNLLAFLSLAAVVTAVQFLQVVSLDPLQNLLLDCADPQTPGQEAACTSALGSPALVSIGLVLILQILIYLTMVGVIRGALWATQGRIPAFDALLSGRNLLVYLVVQIVYALLVGIGVLLLIVPGILVILFLQFAPYFAVDRGTGLVASCSGSIRIARRNLAAAFVAMALNLIVLLIGSMIFGLLTLIALPFVALVTANIYRQMNGEAIVEAYPR